MPVDRRTDHALRKLVILGNHLSMWAGRTPATPAETGELGELLEAWDKALLALRTERKEVEHISL